MDYLLNLDGDDLYLDCSDRVLNLIINGLPSKHTFGLSIADLAMCFKPYYKWITF